MLNTIKKYRNLFRNILNSKEYLLHKSKYQTRNLHFITKPERIKFEVPGNLYIVFKEIFMQDFYHIQKLLDLLPSNATIIDIGANAGFFPVLLLSKRKDLTVYAYEPLPSNIQWIERLIRNNPHIKNNLKLFQLAVGAEAAGTLELFLENTEAETSIASIHRSFNAVNTSSIRIPSTNLSSIIEQNKLEHVDFLKLDCEGSEYDILYNSPDEVLKKISCMGIETHELPGEKNNHIALQKFLESKGYRIESEIAGNGCYYLFALR